MASGYTDVTLSWVNVPVCQCMFHLVWSIYALAQYAFLCVHVGLCGYVTTDAWSGGHWGGLNSSSERTSSRQRLPPSSMTRLNKCASREQPPGTGQRTAPGLQWLQWLQVAKKNAESEKQSPSSNKVCLNGIPSIHSLTVCHLWSAKIFQASVPAPIHQ